MQQFKKEIIEWKVIPESLPTVIRNCSKCGKQSEFESSGNFRVNANHKLIDIWLIYQCKKCNTTWNMEIFSRINPKTIQEETYRKFMENNSELAEQYAFDMNIHNKNNAVMDYAGISYRIEGKEVDLKLQTEPMQVRIRCQYPINTRIDKVLSEKLKVSRSEIKKMCQKGLIKSEGIEDFWKVKVKDGLEFIVLTSC